MNNLKLSIITPSFNQGRFIVDSINSVLLQDYSNYEHIIIDGGSTDNTIEILNHYKHLNWISERDNGPANAINKGLFKVEGDVIAWINSDDYYNNDVFSLVMDIFNTHTLIDFVYGNLTFVSENKEIILSDKTPQYSFEFLANYYADAIRQPAIFFRRALFEKIGYLDENLKVVFDYDFFLRMIKIAKPYYLDHNIAFVRDYKGTITRKNLRKQGFEVLSVSRKNGGRFFNRLLLTTVLRKLLFPNLSIIKNDN